MSLKKPDNINLSKINDVKKSIIEDDLSDYVFLRLPKIKKDFLSEGINTAPEEYKISFFDIYDCLKRKKFVILTKPSGFIPDGYCDSIYIDQNGSTTNRDNAKEMILHNV